MTRYRYRIINNTPNPRSVFFVHSRPGAWATVKQIALADGTPVRLNTMIYDDNARKCLQGLEIRCARDESKISIYFQGIHFECMSPNAKKPTEPLEQIQKCLQRMRDGKCPYKLARQLYTGIKSKQK